MAVKRMLNRQKHRLIGNKFTAAMHALRGMRRDEKQLHHVRTYMFHHFNEALIDHLRSKHTKEEDYKQAFEKEVQSFYHSSEKMMDLYIRVFAVINEVIELVDKEEYQDLKSSYQLMKEAEQYKDPMIFTDKQIEEVHGLKRVYERAEKDAEEMRRNDRRITHGHKPKHLGMLSVHKRNSSLIRDIKKADYILGEKHGRFKDLQDKIHNELNQGIKVDFPVILKEYVIDFDDVERVIRRIKKDVFILIEHHLEEHRKEIEVWNHFRSLIPEGHSSIPDSLRNKMNVFYGNGDHNSLIDLAIEYLKKERRAEKYIEGMIHYDENEEITLMHRFEHDKSNAMRHAYQTQE